MGDSDFDTHGDEKKIVLLTKGRQKKKKKYIDTIMETIIYSTFIDIF